MTERQFHELMDAIYDLAGQAGQDPDIAWDLPARIVGITVEITAGGPAAEWAQRWKRGAAPEETSTNHA